MKRMIAVSSLALMVGLTTGCNSEKTSETKAAAVQKEKELVVKDIFNKAAEEFKKEEYVTMTYGLVTKGNNKSEDMKLKIQMEPKTKRSRSEMNVSGTIVISYEVDGKIVNQVKNPNTGELITIPADQFNAEDFKVVEAILNDLLRPNLPENKMKVEKDGEKYKLIFRLKGKEAADTLQKIDRNGNLKELSEGINVDFLNVQYIFTKDYKVEAFKVDIKASADKEAFQGSVDVKVTSYEKFDPIQLPEGK
ncbi:hypothetical protein [Bacillus cereus group sp. BfR-BA-01380]|uniref:hypothetical protein n=1 Tax=Bacillus cereus group sp. BfR-BA-01380 TaxID=2920324 RepID=UPI001F569162|nr:hypothetical protein [Bacillus cereus group sp. BfR-BA-01380]